MNLDELRESESMSMDTDESAVFRRHSSHDDSVKMNSPGPSGEGMMFDFHPQDHQLAGSIETSIHSLPSHPPSDSECLSGSHGPPRLTVLASSSPPASHLQRVADINQNYRLAGQHRDILASLESSLQEGIPRKRKRSHDLPHAHIMNHDHIPYDDAFTDGANSQSRRRTRPRLQTQQVGEFSPLLIMSPSQERDSPTEETISAFHYPLNVVDPSHSVRRYFHFEDLPEYGPRILQSSSSSNVDGLENPRERGRSDSANSFAEVALASTMTPKHGRLSTLQDFWLPRPFEETERPSLGSIKVHERGLEVPPSFLSTGGRRVGGQRASRESADSQTDTLGHPIRAPVYDSENGTRAISPRSVAIPLEPGPSKFFDKPICDSPDSISPDEDGSHTLGYPVTQATHGARVGSAP